MYHKVFRYLLLISIIIFSGCTFNPNYPPITRKKQSPVYSNVGIAVMESNISVQNNIDEGVFHSISTGSSGCIGFGEFGFYGMLVVPLCLSVNVPLEIIKGTQTSEKLEIIKKEKGTVQANVQSKELQQRLQDIAIAYANKHMINARRIDEYKAFNNEDKSMYYSLLSSKGIDTVIEYEITDITFDEVNVENLPIYISIKAKSRLISTDDGHIIDKWEKKVHSNIYPYQEWMANDFNLLTKEYHVLLNTVVSNSIDDLLLLYYPTLPKDLTVKTSKRESPYYVLQPINPKPVFATPDMREFVHPEKYQTVAHSQRRFVPIYDQQPLFRWEPFPWEHDLVPKERFSDIVYDFEIYKYKEFHKGLFVHHEYVGQLVYAKNGLVNNEHKIEEPLERNTKYLWTVRARFKLDGKPHFTEWGGLYDGGVRGRDQHAWSFGEARGCTSFWKCYLDFEPLNNKKNYYYPIIILEK